MTMGTRKTPCFLDDIKKKEICAILAVGCDRKTAAAYVGCAVSTIYRTAHRDGKFAADLRYAESRCEVLHIKNINNASEKNWRASAWALERRFPHQYGSRRAGTVSGRQITQALGEFARIVSAEIPAGDQRQRLLARLNALAKKFERDWELERQLGTTSAKRTKRPAL